MTEPTMLIYSYTRAQALADGVLVDVSETAREAGIRYPVALTRAVWDSCVEVPARASCQDERGRLWDVVWMLRDAMRRAKAGKSQVLYRVYVVQASGQPLDARPRRRLVTLKAVCGAGDAGEPVVTVMEPNED